MVKVYYGCSISGGYKYVSENELAHIAHEIKDLGHSLISELIEEQKTKNNDSSKMHDLFYAWMKDSDCGIFEISNPSLGVGAEIADMINMKKPVLCLHKKDSAKTSIYLSGKEKTKNRTSHFEIYEYQTLGEAKYAIKKFIEEFIKK